MRYTANTGKHVASWQLHHFLPAVLSLFHLSLCPPLSLLCPARLAAVSTQAFQECLQMFSLTHARSLRHTSSPVLINREAGIVLTLGRDINSSFFTQIPQPVSCEVLPSEGFAGNETDIPSVPVSYAESFSSLCFKVNRLGVVSGRLCSAAMKLIYADNPGMSY